MNRTYQPLSMKKVAEKSSFDEYENSMQVLDQYNYIKKYCTADKLFEWDSKQTKTDERWVGISQHMHAQHIPYIEFSQIVEFIICFPGSSAPVERVFAKARIGLKFGLKKEMLCKCRH